MDTEKILLHEMDTLRQELRHLKDCQVRYFLLSITAAASAIGLGIKLDANANSYSSQLFLVPLIIILPCWWTFFDKATSITRIVGYYRILEQMVLHEGKHHFFGWETSLSIFRRFQESNSSGADPQENHAGLKNTIALLRLHTSHKYWVLNWYTFFTLSVLSLVLSVLSGTEPYTQLLAVFFITLSTFANFRTVIELVFGQLSFSAHEQTWEKILNATSGDTLPTQDKRVPSQ
jgi:hypothetical protein